MLLAAGSRHWQDRFDHWKILEIERISDELFDGERMERCGDLTTQT
jgi:hypothetical protein